MSSKCVFYRPEHTANGGGGTLEVEFWWSWNVKIKKPMDRAQRVDEKCVYLFSYHFRSNGY